MRSKEISSCKECPFYRVGPYGRNAQWNDDDYCELKEEYLEDYGRTIPDWCPLRVEDVLIKLKV